MFEVAASVVLATFSLGWIVYGIGWIRRTAKSFSAKPVN